MRTRMIRVDQLAAQLFAVQYYTTKEWERIGKLLTDNWREVLILGTVTLIVILAVIWQPVSRRRRKDFDYDSPPRLFSDLCRAHRLSWANRRLLKQLATARGLASPAVLFVEPEYFDMTNVPAALKGNVAELRTLRHTLFD